MARYFRKIIIRYFILLTISAPSNSQSTDLDFDVLPVVTARCVFHDSFGLIWIGTYGGLLRYDGYNLKQYSNIPFDSTSLSNNWVMAIEEDSTGNLWIGTFGGGLNYFNRRTGVFERYNSRTMNQMSDMISKINVNDNGSLWIGSIDNGINLFRNDNSGRAQITNFPLTDESDTELIQPNNGVLDLYKDKNGIIWIGSVSQGLIKFNPQTDEMIKYTHDPENSNCISFNTVSCITGDDSDYLWIGTGHPSIPPGYGNGLNMFNRKTGEFKHFIHNNSDKNSICSNTISSLLIDKNGTLWIGSWGNYLNSISIHDLISNNSPAFIHHKNLARDVVTSLYEDKLDNIWIGVFGMELYKIDRQRNVFDFYSRTDQYPNCLTHSTISAIYVDNSENVMFGTRGLDIYNPDTRQYSHYYSNPQVTNGLIDNNITGIQEDNKGLFWIATRNGGINIYNPKTKLISKFQPNGNDTDGKISNSIQCLLKRSNGDFWIASADGTIQLYQQSTGNIFNYVLDNGAIGNLNIYDLCEDKNGILWIGTMHSGMYSLKREENKITEIQNYQHNPNDRTSLSNNWVSDILKPDIVDTNALWIATNIGLNRFDLKTKQFSHFFHDAGLTSDLVLKVLEDNDGNIWCATINGISVVNIKTGKIKSYGKGDGMPFTDFSNIGQNAAKSPDGRLFFGGLSGALSFLPEQLTNNPNIPPIILTDFKIFHESVNLDTAIQFKKKILLPYNQNAISFEFAALNFTNPKKNQYAYKMEGLIEDWISIGNERTASFTNLNPGEYVFWVKGSNNHGLWNEEGTSVKVIIMPPWWRTNLAYIFYFVFICFVIWLSWRFQTSKLKISQQLTIEQLNAEKLQEIDKLKSQFFANISHEFRTPLTLILSPIEQLISDTFKGSIKESYLTIRSNAKKLLRLVNQLLSLSKLEAGQVKLQVSRQDIIPVVKRIINLFSSLAEHKNIDFNLSSPESLILYFDEEKIETIINNLLSNAFKFTPDGGEVEVVVSLTPLPSASPLCKGGKRGVGITVSNTGPNIPANEIEKIFDRFYQVPLDKKNINNYTNNRKYPLGQVESNYHVEGTGIGLSLTKDLVELHHGQITVESKPKGKTTFTIIIPIDKENYRENEIISATDIDSLLKKGVRGILESEIDTTKVDGDELITQKPESQNTPVILIVEDNEEIRNYLHKNLEEKYHIIEAQNGKFGIQIAEKELPDLIISDVMMPEMDGFEFCDKIKSDINTSHIPVILLTARASREDKLEGLKTGADDYLAKPFDLEELTVRVENLINQRISLKERFLKEALYGLDKISSHAAEKEFVEKITEIININIDNPDYTVDNFAYDIGMSRAQLFRKVKAWTNITPHDFIRLCRLKKAAIMLKEKSHNVTEAAFAVGFKSVSHFSKAFNKQFNQSPGNYFKN